MGRRKKENTKVSDRATGIIWDSDKVKQRAAAGGYEVLPKTVPMRGVGIPGLKSRLLERIGKKALYRRDDGIYEVFEVKVKEATTLFGRSYPKREAYPTNEDFGYTAECFSSYEAAKRYYDNYMKRSLKGIKL